MTGLQKFGYAVLYSAYAGFAAFALYWWLDPAEYSPVFVAMGIAGIIAILLVRALVPVLVAAVLGLVRGLRTVMANPAPVLRVLGGLVVSALAVWATITWWEVARLALGFAAVWALVFWAWKTAGRLFRDVLMLRPSLPGNEDENDELFQRSRLVEGAVLRTRINEYSD